jgi:hypothetical protein
VSSILIEAKPVPLTVGRVHLYLVYRDDIGNEWVIRGGPVGGEIVNGTFAYEINKVLSDSSDARGTESPADRHSTEINLPNHSADEAWAIMVRYARMLEEVGFPEYDFLSTNSNAFAGALLFALGLDPSSSLPDGVSYLTAYGLPYYVEIVDVVAPPVSGDVLGTGGPDHIFGIQIAEAIFGFNGDDYVKGGPGDDRIRGGMGHDVLLGDEDADSLYGDDGRDALDGGFGADKLDGGAGNDLLDGGDGTGDFAIFSGNRSDYSITRGVNTLTISGPDGVDILKNTEVLEFGDGEIVPVDSLEGPPATTTTVAVDPVSADQTVRQVSKYQSATADSSGTDTFVFDPAFFNLGSSIGYSTGKTLEFLKTYVTVSSAGTSGVKFTASDLFVQATGFELFKVQGWDTVTLAQVLGLIDGTLLADDHSSVTVLTTVPVT